MCFRGESKIERRSGLYPERVFSSPLWGVENLYRRIKSKIPPFDLLRVVSEVEPPEAGVRGMFVFTSPHPDLMAEFYVGFPSDAPPHQYPIPL
jgi:hypothetical protein